MRVPDRSSSSWSTPLYQQYWKLRDSVPSVQEKGLMFFRLGDFFELFGEDAVLASPLLQVQLTSRDRSNDPIPMCGVPFHAWENYAEKLLAHGYKIALADQTEEAGQKKLVERQVTRILTPGLPIDPTKISDKEAHYLMVLTSMSDRYEIAVLDFLGRKLFVEDFDDVKLLEKRLQQLRPKEIVIAEPLSPHDEISALLKNYRDRISVWGAVRAGVASGAQALLAEYLSYTQRWSREQVEKYLPTAKSFQNFENPSRYARVQREIVEQWDIDPYLMDLLDACGSAGGRRKLRELLTSPLTKVRSIQLRQKMLQALPWQALLDDSSQVYDLERILGRIYVGASKPIDLLRVAESLIALRRLFEFFMRHPSFSNWKEWAADEELADFSASFDEIKTLSEEFSRTITRPEDATNKSEEIDFILPGADAEYDRLKNLYTDLESWIENFETKLKSETQINNLKVRFNRVAGFYIEVSKANSAKVPCTFERRQTLVNAERFTDPRLKEREEEILGAEDKLRRRAKEIFAALEEKLRTKRPALEVCCENFAYIDAWAGALKALQKLRALGPWNYPTVNEGAFSFTIVDGRHPLIEFQDKTFIPNSLSLGEGKKRVLLLTGPNMAGKSTLMRQTGLILVLAQIGLPVPAESLHFAPARGFYSRMGASDRILHGESTFMVEMREMATILREEDENSFVLIDEVGRGTSSSDGLAIAQAILEHFAQPAQALTLFATHFHELSRVAATKDCVLNASMTIKEWKGELIFLRKIVYEPASSSYGLYVAKLAGLPSGLLQKAKRYQELQREQQLLQQANSQLSLDFVAAPQEAPLS